MTDPVSTRERLDGLELYAVSKTRLATFSIITLGLYEIYWFYRNWKAIQRVDEKVNHPGWRAVFALFYCHALFLYVLESAKSKGYVAKFNVLTLTTLYVALLLVGRAWSSANNISQGVDMTLFFVSILTFVPLLYVQDAILYLSEKQHLARMYKTSMGLVAIMIVGFILLCGSILAVFNTPHLTTTQQNQATILKDRADSLSTQYDSCSAALEKRYGSIDKSNQTQISAYNADDDACNAVLVEQNRVVDQYNKLIGAQ